VRAFLFEFTAFLVESPCSSLCIYLYFSISLPSIFARDQRPLAFSHIFVFPTKWHAQRALTAYSQYFFPFAALLPTDATEQQPQQQQQLEAGVDLKSVVLRVWYDPLGCNCFK
jgi:hypothetical protein